MMPRSMSNTPSSSVSSIASRKPTRAAGRPGCDLVEEAIGVAVDGLEKRAGQHRAKAILVAAAATVDTTHGVGPLDDLVKGRVLTEVRRRQAKLASGLVVEDGEHLDDVGFKTGEGEREDVRETLFETCEDQSVRFVDEELRVALDHGRFDQRVEHAVVQLVREDEGAELGLQIGERGGRGEEVVSAADKGRVVGHEDTDGLGLASI